LAPLVPGHAPSQLWLILDLKLSSHLSFNPNFESSLQGYLKNQMERVLKSAPHSPYHEQDPNLDPVFARKLPASEQKLVFITIQGRNKLRYWPANFGS
jgi:hypothetical protein